MVRVRSALFALACLALPACSDSGGGAAPSATAPPTTVAVTGLCTLVDESRLVALFGPGMVFGTPESTDTRCSWPVLAAGGGARGRIYLGGSNIPYDTTVENGAQLGQTMTDVSGLGARAYFTASASDGLYWITIEHGDGTLSVAAEYKNGAGPPAEAELIATLQALAAEYVAGR